MKRIYAWSSNKKNEFTIPIYHQGPWWAIIGEEISSRLIGNLFDIENWFEKFTIEYEGKEIIKG